MDETKERICREVDALLKDLSAISDFLLANPEVAYQELKACEYLSRVLGENGFKVEKGVGKVETSFLLSVLSFLISFALPCCASRLRFLFSLPMLPAGLKLRSSSSTA